MTTVHFPQPSKSLLELLRLWHVTHDRGILSRLELLLQSLSIPFCLCVQPLLLGLDLIQ